MIKKMGKDVSNVKYSDYVVYDTPSATANSKLQP